MSFDNVEFDNSNSCCIEFTWETKPVCYTVNTKIISIEHTTRMFLTRVGFHTYKVGDGCFVCD